MNTQDRETSLVLESLQRSLAEVSMGTPVGEIVTAGRTRRRRRRLVAGATGVAALTAVSLGLPALNNATAPPSTGVNQADGSTLHTAAVAFILSKHSDGTIHVSWDKEQYFRDRVGLEKALRDAGFPVLIKEGQFCAGPDDDTSLNPSGTGPGVDAVMRGERTGDHTVSIVFTPSKMPAGKQLFIGYLNADQLAVTHGRPGSVERLVSIAGPLTCTTQAPPPGPARGGGQGSDVKPG
jgi:hypothetical protein